MSNVPKAGEVDRALKAVVRAVENSLTVLNGRAGKVMATGKYEKAQALAERGLQVKSFIQEVEGLRKRWRELRRGSKATRKNKQEKTPLWAYYQPILRALDAVGGEAKRQTLMVEAEKQLASSFKDGDRDAMSGGRLERWQVMVLRSRKHLVQEGWIEPGTGTVWRITSAGRRAAKADLARTKKSV